MRNYFNSNINTLNNMAATLSNAGFNVVVVKTDNFEVEGPSYITTNADRHSIMAAWRVVA